MNTISEVVLDDNEAVLLEGAASGPVTELSHDIIQQALEEAAQESTAVNSRDKHNSLLLQDGFDLSFSLNDRVPDEKDLLSTFNEYLQFSTETTENFTAIPHFVDGEISYQLQIPEETPVTAGTSGIPPKTNNISKTKPKERNIKPKEPERRPSLKEKTIFLFNQQRQAKKLKSKNENINPVGRLYVSQEANKPIYVSLNNATISVPKLDLGTQPKVISIDSNIGQLVTGQQISSLKLSPTVINEVSLQNQNLNNQTERASPIFQTLRVLPVTSGATKSLTANQLKEIAALLEKGNIKIPTTGGSAKLLCRVVNPEDFSPQVEKSPAKKGRPSKSKTAKPEKKDEIIVEKEEEIVSKRTRSGRLTRPPCYISDFYKELSSEEPADKRNIDENNENNLFVPNPSKRNFKDHVRCPTCHKVYLSLPARLQHFEKHPDHLKGGDILDKLREEVQREEVKKYIGAQPIKGKKGRTPLKNITLKQIISNTEQDVVVEAAGSTVARALTLWDFILLRMDSLQGQSKGKVITLIDELKDLIENLKAVSEHILWKTDMVSPASISIDDDILCRILRLEKGTYIPVDSGLKRKHQIDDEILSKRPRLETLPDVKEVICNEVLTDDVYSDPTGLDSVDQIVNERLRTMAEEELISSLPTSSQDEDIMSNLLNSTPPLQDTLFSSQSDFKIGEIGIQPISQLDFTDLNLSNEFTSNGVDSLTDCKEIYTKPDS